VVRAVRVFEAEEEILKGSRQAFNGRPAARVGFDEEMGKRRAGEDERWRETVVGELDKGRRMLLVPFGINNAADRPVRVCEISVNAGFESSTQR
jgi:hypothetical protein